MDEDTTPDGGPDGPKIVLKHRNTLEGRREFYALIYCPTCGSSLTSGEWMDGMGVAVQAARESYADHKVKWPQCAKVEVPA